MKKIGRPVEYRDKKHAHLRRYKRELYKKRRLLVLAKLREDRKNNPEKYRDRDRKRYEKDKERRLALAKKWTRNNPEKRKKALQEWEARNPQARWASTAVNNALRDGRLVRKACEVCGEAKRVQAHHDDYLRPLDVRWLCVNHHMELHKKRRAEKRGKP